MCCLHHATFMVTVGFLPVFYDWNIFHRVRQTFTINLCNMVFHLSDHTRVCLPQPDCKLIPCILRRLYFKGTIKTFQYSPKWMEELSIIGKFMFGILKIFKCSQDFKASCIKDYIFFYNIAIQLPFIQSIEY